MKAIGSYPNIIYRVFKKYKHAKEFTQGIIRFSTFECYSLSDDPIRQDKTEGESHIKNDGLNHHHSFSEYNQIYILSFCKTLESAQKSNFGNFIVIIHNPKELANSITNYLEKQSFKCFGGVDGNEVLYNYGEEVLTKFNYQELSKLTCFQKPYSYHDENEFRFVIATENIHKNHLFIKLDTKNKVLKNIILLDNTKDSDE
jgi:hypothetical protein